MKMQEIKIFYQIAILRLFRTRALIKNTRVTIKIPINRSIIRIIIRGELFQNIRYKNLKLCN